jgi:NAD(P)-dependent dehydrogenase (short-subunit alcohol dehydrogenase family)
VRPFPFDGAVAVVTGAGSGIGRGIAASLAARGVRVLTTDLLEDRAAETAALLDAGGGVARGLRCDVTVQDDLVAAREAAFATWGRVDIVVNNVGVLALGDPEVIPSDEWRRILEINVMGHVRSNEVFLPGLIAQGSGHVVNTASVAGLLNFSHDRLPYAASKAAVIAISEGLRIHLARHGVGVSCLVPAGVATNIVEQMRFFGELRPVTTPDLAMVEPSTVGELVAAAIAANRFLVLTDPRAQDLLEQKYADVDAYLDARIRALSET